MPETDGSFIQVRNFRFRALQVSSRKKKTIEGRCIFFESHIVKYLNTKKVVNGLCTKIEEKHKKRDGP